MYHPPTTLSLQSEVFAIINECVRAGTLWSHPWSDQPMPPTLARRLNAASHLRSQLNATAAGIDQRNKAGGGGGGASYLALSGCSGSSRSSSSRFAASAEPPPLSQPPPPSRKKKLQQQPAQPQQHGGGSGSGAGLLQLVFGQQEQDLTEADWDRLTIRGTCTTLEKRYFRLIQVRVKEVIGS